MTTNTAFATQLADLRSAELRAEAAQHRLAVAAAGTGRVRALWERVIATRVTVSRGGALRAA